MAKQKPDNAPRPLIATRKCGKHEHKITYTQYLAMVRATTPRQWR